MADLLGGALSSPGFELDMQDMVNDTQREGERVVAWMRNASDELFGDDDGVEESPVNDSVRLDVATESEIPGDSTTTSSVLRGTTRGWLAGTPLELYGSQDNIDELALKRKMSTGGHIDYILVYRLPEDEEDKADLIKALREHDVLEGAEGQIGRAFKRRAFLSAISAVANIEEEVAEDERTVFVKINVPFDVLKQQAEETKLKLPLSEDHAPSQHIINSRFEQLKSSITSLPSFLTSWREPDVPEVEDYFAGLFTLEREQQFRDYDKEFKLFTEGQRNLLAYNILLHARYGDKSHQIGVSRLITNGSFVDAYPLHDGPYDDEEVADEDEDGHRHRLYVTWGRLNKFYMIQPLDHIREYFGEQVALYFAWLGFYTTWLWIPSAVGVLVLIYGFARFSSQTDARDLCSSNITVCPLCDSGCDAFPLNTTCSAYELAYVFDNEATVLFALFMAVWGSFFLDFWKRKNIETAYDWDVLDFEEEEPNRPEFVATTTKINPVTGIEEPAYPKKVQYLKLCASIATITLMLSLVIAVLLGIIIYRLIIGVVLYKSGEDDEDGVRQNASTITALTAAAINLILIVILNKVYGGLAVSLTNWENHRKQSSYESHLAVKIFLFQFVNSFSSLFYIAFFKGQETGRPGDYNTLFGFRQDECPPYGCLLELTIQLAIIMIGKQAINNAREIILPKISACLARCCGKKAMGDLVLPWERELVELSVYPRMGLFYEYLEMIIQFGFLSLFVPAFPAAPLFALLNNILEIRVDASKHVQHYRRPPARRAEDIGVWEHIVAFISYFSVLTNALVIAFTSSYIDKEVYRGTTENNSLSGYIDRIYPLSPVMPGQGDLNLVGCHYRSFREADGQKGQFYYQVLAARVGFVIIFEHVVFLLKVLVQYLIPDVPKSVSVAIQSEQYHARLALQNTQAVEKDTTLTSRMNSSRKSAHHHRITSKA